MTVIKLHLTGRIQNARTVVGHACVQLGPEQPRKTHEETEMRWLWGALALAVAVTPTVARAHMGSTKYVLVSRTADGATVVADIDPIDVAWEIDLERPDERAILAQSAAVGRWLERAMRVTSNEGACRASSEPARFITRDERRFVSVSLTYECPSGATNVRLVDGAVFDSDPQHEAIVKLTAHGRESANILRIGRQEMALGDHPSLVTTMGRFVLEGAIHLITGYDHVLFLLSLLLVAGQVAARDGFKRGIRDVGIVVTGFTIGHSVTLIAAALDVVVLPSQLVESVIALSIVIVAVWNLWKPDMRKGLPWVAMLFGLIHGFGFSSVLKELVLPTGDRVVALLSFNVGIELAQLLIVAIVLGPLAWAAKKTWYRRAVVQAGSLAIAVVATYWFVERALGLGA